VSVEDGSRSSVPPLRGIRRDDWAELISHGRSSGTLTAEEIVDVLHDVDLSPDAIDVVRRAIENVGITVDQTFEVDAQGIVTGLTTGIASHLLPAPPEATERTLLDFAMRYHNRYASEDGVWKFAERALEVVWVETRPVRRFSPAMLGRELRGFAAVD